MTWSWHANRNNPGMDRNPPTDRMDNRPRIRDTAGQDQVRATPAHPKRRQWLVGGIAIVGCITFFFSLKASTQLYFLLWNLGGLAIYLLWSSKNARLAKTPEA